MVGGHQPRVIHSTGAEKEKKFGAQRHKETKEHEGENLLYRSDRYFIVQAALAFRPVTNLHISSAYIQPCSFVALQYCTPQNHSPPFL
jgi:hypothetical protein